MRFSLIDNIRKCSKQLTKLCCVFFCIAFILSLSLSHSLDIEFLPKMRRKSSYFCKFDKSMKIFYLFFLYLVLLLVLLIDPMISLSIQHVNIRSDSLTAEQLKGLDEYFSRKLNEEYFEENSSQSTLPKRDDSSNMKHILDCIQRSNVNQEKSKWNFLLILIKCHHMVKNHGL